MDQIQPISKGANKIYSIPYISPGTTRIPKQAFTIVPQPGMNIFRIKHTIAIRSFVGFISSKGQHIL